MAEASSSLLTSTTQAVVATNTNDPNQNQNQSQPSQPIESRIDVGSTTSTPPPRNPSPHFVQGSRIEYFKVCVRLYYAALSGDWNVVKDILKDHPQALNASISNRQDTILHVAARANQAHLVKMMVNEMKDTIDLTLQDREGNTPFSLAVAAGASQVIEILRHQNSDLAITRGGHDLLPLYMACLFGHNAIALSLYPLTNPILQERERRWTFFTCIHNGLYVPGMRVLIRKSHKQSKALILVKELWKQILKDRSDSEIKDLIRGPTRLLLDAAEVGNHDFIVALICSYHDLLWECDRERRTIFHIAVENRHDQIFRLIHEIGSIKSIIFAFKDSEGNNIFHLMMDPSLREKKNNKNETASVIFSKAHANLLKEGESWMKKTAESCTIVAALIATVVFTVAFSVPGGNNSDTGLPIHIKHNAYTFFSLSNGIAMFSSSTSILMFLSILTSRYAESDFLRSLPKRLIIGLTSLFVSMATMTIAFCMAVFIAYRQSSMWIPILITTLQIVPITLFLYLLYPLQIDIFCSTFNSHSLFKQTKRKLQWAVDSQECLIPIQIYLNVSQFLVLSSLHLEWNTRTSSILRLLRWIARLKVAKFMKQVMVTSVAVMDYVVVMIMISGDQKDEIVLKK
ncbi:hypothetical protein G4B88_010038 [Cannabis sativa]|uniref:PGG domain-containing protein n=1 Tax=Cannabis sativa TaxID=3483 RepID=A0A7J6E5X4_CANSA|nr:hypothetical protein G4B88_010038 [Cannabis sativa]